ncbi:MAG: peptide-methionine (S)-S-oxide reductase MsrA [Gemmatimonadaceae bacterium]|jgi:peptide-methionine (S)-S-oxide reductase|nr:peptide-methionine (S)-S-oxide reductase MsrA [Gemmatimonadaceae bacterium]
MPTPIETATLGGGCFWCIEAVFERIDGVVDLRSGYAGGHVPNPTYEQVCGKQTGHVEVVQVDFDPAVLPYRDVLEIFFAAHDPTTKDRQGNDVGPQYRSAIFTHSDAQAATAREVIAAFDADHTFGAPIVTEVRPLDRYWHGEAYHQRYFRQHGMQPYCAFVIAPKVAKIRKRYTDRLRDTLVP